MNFSHMNVSLYDWISLCCWCCCCCSLCVWHVHVHLASCFLPLFMINCLLPLLFLFYLFLFWMFPFVVQKTEKTEKKRWKKQGKEKLLHEETNERLNDWRNEWRNEWIIFACALFWRILHVIVCVYVAALERMFYTHTPADPNRVHRLSMLKCMVVGFYRNFKKDVFLLLFFSW